MIRKVMTAVEMIGFMFPVVGALIVAVPVMLTRLGTMFPANGQPNPNPPRYYGRCPF